MKTYRAVATTVFGVVLGSLANAQYADDFDTNTSGNYNVVTSGDAAALFLFDYSTMGIPSAPNSVGGTTLGVRLEANVTTGATHAVTLHTTQTFTGDYVVKMDAWINANGPFPGGGTGSTEYITFGVGGDGVTNNLNASSGSGGWFTYAGEGGSSRDFRAYKNAGEQFAESGQWAAGLSSAGGGAHNNWDPYYAHWGSIDVGNLPVQGANVGGPAQQNGVTNAGTMGFAWHEITIMVDADGGVGGTPLASWAIDGLTIATLDAGVGSPFLTDGTVTLGYMDPFTSVSDNAMLSFGIIDNLRVGSLSATRTYARVPAHPTNGAATWSVVSDPSINSVAAFDINYAAPGIEPGLIVSGLAPAALPFLDFDILVLPPFITLSFATTPPVTSFAFPLANDPTLVGGEIYFQAALLDLTGGSANGLVSTNGLMWRVGL